MCIRDSLGVHAVDRRERAAKHVVDAVVLVRALHRDHVAGLLHHAHQAAVAAGIGADRAQRLVCEVEAQLAQPDLVLDLADRLSESSGIVVGCAQNVEGCLLYTSRCV